MTTNIITHIRKYAPLSNEEATELYSYVTMQVVSKKEWLLKEGNICRSQYFVEKAALWSKRLASSSHAEASRFQILPTSIHQ